MIIEYKRPATLEEALKLLARHDPLSVPLAGGSALNRPSPDPVAAVDLQSLGLDHYEVRGNALELGAMLTLQTLLEAAEPPQALKQVIQHEATHNLRQVSTVAGSLVVADGRSPFACAFLALDASLTIMSADRQMGEEQIPLGDLLPFRVERLRGRLITQVSIPLNVRLAYQYVARAPADLPLVCAAMAIWPSGRTRLALGGFGNSPALAFDGTEASGVDVAAENAYSQAEDQWASAAYRQDVAGVLARRCLKELDVA